MLGATDFDPTSFSAFSENLLNESDDLVVHGNGSFLLKPMSGFLNNPRHLKFWHELRHAADDLPHSRNSQARISFTDQECCWHGYLSVGEGS